MDEPIRLRDDPDADPGEATLECRECREPIDRGGCHNCGHGHVSCGACGAGYSTGRAAPPAVPTIESLTEEQKRAASWMEIALIHGYNELARKAGTLGEKIYFRMARDMAQAGAEAFGTTFTPAEDLGAIIFTMRASAPRVIFHERDIEGMRAAVAKYDAEHGA